MIARETVKDIYPLTPFQEGLVFHDALEREAGGDSPRAYLQQLAVTVRGPLDLPAFVAAWQCLVDRHDILRTVFRPTGADRPLQIVLKQRRLAPDVIDARADGPEAARRAAALYAEAQARRPFDIRRDMLLRLGLIRIAEGETRVVLGFHHLLMDGWCIGLLQDDLGRAYRALAVGAAPHLPPAVPFGRFVKAADARRTPEALAWWRDYLAGYDTPLALPGRRAGESSGGDGRDPRTLEIGLGRDLSDRLAARAATLGVTAGTMLQTLWGMLLAKVEGRRDVVFGAVASTRMPDLPGSEAILGPCIGMLPVRVRFSGRESAADLLRAAQRESVERLARVHCPLAEIQGVSAPRAGLIDHYFVYENYPLDEGFRGEAQLLAPGVTIHDVRPFETSSYDFGVLALPGAETRLAFSFNAARVDPEAVARLGRWFAILAAGVAEAPDTAVDALTLLDAGEAARVAAWGRGAPVAPAEPVAATWPSLARSRDDAPALRVGDRTVTYDALAERAARLAGWLHRAAGVAPGEPVLLLAEADDRMAVAMMACLLLGCPFVPVEPDHPAARIAHVARDSGARLALTNRDPGRFPDLAVPVVSLARAEGEADPAPGPLPEAGADPTAYIIYTSGTTGRPKGVRVGQRALANYARWFNTLPGTGAHLRTMLVTSPAFDLGYTGLFGALLGGGCVSLLGEDERRDPGLVLDRLGAHGITVLKATPSYLGLLLAVPDGEARLAAAPLRLLLLGGEPQDFALLQRLRALCPSLRLFNHYGPTETTIGCAAGPLDDLAEAGAGPQRIGRPIAGARVLVTDDALRPVPAGLVGELVVGGEGVAQGYVDAAPADAARFTILPGAGDSGEDLRVYRTGDRVRWLPDGCLEFLGRTDDQVKVRGYRVSLKEVEAALRSLDGVSAAAVLAETRAGVPELVAYLVPADGAVLTPAALRAALAQLLPAAMLPARFLPVSRFPLTPNGKLDRAALRQHHRPAPAAPAEPAPATATEARLRAIWQEVLFLEKVGLDDDFFALGGHSLKAILIAARVQAATGRPLPLRSLFDHPTIRGLAAHLEAGTPSPDGLVLLRRGAAGAAVVGFLPPALGTATVYREVVEPLRTDRACLGLQAPGFDCDAPFAGSLAEYGRLFAAMLQPRLDARPVTLVGWSFGAALALATGLQLESEGRSVALVLLDGAPPRADRGPTAAAPVVDFASLRTRPYWGRVLAAMDAMPPADLARIERLAQHHHDLARRDDLPGVLNGPITCIEATGGPGRAGMAGFRRFTRDRFELHEVGGDHYSMFHPPNLAQVQALLDGCLGA
jgi:amino acid adenylation domain-containing protein